MPTPKTKRLLTHSTVTVIAAIVAVLLTKQFSSAYPLANPVYGFQYYEPGQLPAGFAITDKRVNVSQYGGKIHGVSAELNLRTEDWVYGIREYRHTDEVAVTTAKNYDLKSVGVTCQQHYTPQGRRYRLCHWTDYGRISVFEVKFIRGNTFIETTFPTTTNTVIPLQELGNYVDSFKRSNTMGWRVLSGSV